ncbi:MAG: N-acetyltransferase [Paramuribaculum sp.]|nr:N-acetyltransferase [Paramuribaculum sp.]MDE7471419.1 N-acetyltransferase [Paramuribaculum sp.]
MNYTIENDRIYATDQTGKTIAEVTFPSKNGISTIDHTFVDESLRGQGVAGELVKLAADKILADGNKIGATCTYAITWFQRHPEYSVSCYGPAACRIKN